LRPAPRHRIHKQATALKDHRDPHLPTAASRLEVYDRAAISISIDGLDNTDETTGAARVALSPEIVREFQIVNSGISAESGGAAGGAINVVTKTGTNTFHGDAFFWAE